jgi:ribosomal protein L40E
MVARLFGRHSSGDKQARPSDSGPAADDVVPAESWPRATPWSESPLGVGHRWTTDTVGSVETGTPDGVTAEQTLDLTAPETLQEAQATPEFAPATPEFAPTAAAVAAVEPVAPVAPVALEAALKPVKITAAQHREPAHQEATPPPDLEAAPPPSDARSAASIRQTAIANSADRPADETAAAGSVVQADAPSGLEEAAEAGEDTRRKPASRGTADRQAAPTRSAEPAEPVAPWPPFGASWPAQNPQSGAWPGPGNVLPAVVAAQWIRPAAEVEIWAQSSQEVMNRGTVRVCHHCALPVSTQARFCRRCGTNQA